MGRWAVVIFKVLNQKLNYNNSEIRINESVAIKNFYIKITKLICSEFSYAKLRPRFLPKARDPSP